jgi:hypothetical protein
MHLEMAEALKTLNMRGRGLLRGRWWPVGPKLVFDQMAAAFPEIIDDSFVCVLHVCVSVYATV